MLENSSPVGNSLFENSSSVRSSLFENLFPIGNLLFGNSFSFGNPPSLTNSGFLLSNSQITSCLQSDCNNPPSQPSSYCERHRCIQQTQIRRCTNGLGFGKSYFCSIHPLPNHDSDKSLTAQTQPHTVSASVVSTVVPKCLKKNCDHRSSVSSKYCAEHRCIHQTKKERCKNVVLLSTSLCSTHTTEKYGNQPEKSEIQQKKELERKHQKSIKENEKETQKLIKQKEQQKEKIIKEKERETQKLIKQKEQQKEKIIKENEKETQKLIKKTQREKEKIIKENEKETQKLIKQKEQQKEKIIKENEKETQKLIKQTHICSKHFIESNRWEQGCQFCFFWFGTVFVALLGAWA